MEEPGEVDNRLAVLCKRLGNLRTEVDAPPRDRVISEAIHNEESLEVHGLPLEWCSEEVVAHIAKILGSVKEVRVEKKGVAFQKVGRARVELDLDTPLSPGTLYNIGEGKIWLDFKYERLPRFCYSCGKVGHFATNCEEVPFDEAKYEDRSSNTFGHWLKAEAKETSPFWQIFYGDRVGEQEEEHRAKNPPAQDTQIVIFTGEQTASTFTVATQPQNRAKVDGIVPDHQEEQHQGKGKGIMNIEEDEQQLMPTEKPSSWTKKAGSKKESRILKSSPAKKLKRYTPYNSIPVELTDFDEANLQETPISLSDGTTRWALVASPNKPPVYK